MLKYLFLLVGILFFIQSVNAEGLIRLEKCEPVIIDNNLVEVKVVGWTDASRIEVSVTAADADFSLIDGKITNKQSIIDAIKLKIAKAIYDLKQYNDEQNALEVEKEQKIDALDISISLKDLH